MKKSKRKKEKHKRTIIKVKQKEGM